MCHLRLTNGKHSEIIRYLKCNMTLEFKHKITRFIKNNILEGCTNILPGKKSYRTKKLHLIKKKQSGQISEIFSSKNLVTIVFEL